MAIQKIISGANIIQGSAVISSGIAGFGHDTSRAKINDIDITASNNRYVDRFSYYNGLTNESVRIGHSMAQHNFIIPQSSLALHESVFSSFLCSFGKVCTLYGPPIRTKCPNCQGGQNYNGTGPLPFINGTICPYCNGLDYLEEENTQTVKLLIYFSPKDFVKYNGLQVGIPDGTIQTRGLISDLPLIQRANELSINNESGFDSGIRYRRLGEFVPFGVRAKTEFLQLWERI